MTPDEEIKATCDCGQGDLCEICHWPADKENNMPKFRKKPVVIKAVHYKGELPTLPNREMTSRVALLTGHHSENLFDLVDLIASQNRFVIDHGDHLIIETLEGDMRVDIGDWIIKGVHGELYPCKPDIFEATYEKV